MLRVYDPAECDGLGVPLDWERCRTCEGTGKRISRPESPPFFESLVPCSTCAGHGSLRAAALDRAGYREAAQRIAPYVGTIMDWRARAERFADAGPIRCGGCGHPMSDGEWEGDVSRVSGIAENLRNDVTFDGGRRVAEEHGLVHWSPCDEGCRHGGREKAPGTEIRLRMPELVSVTSPAELYEASWRAVDVRTLGWPHDLRPERLAVLCLRCYAERGL